MTTAPVIDPQDSSILSRIKLAEFPDNQYVKEETTKRQIYLHHTAGNSNPFNVVEDWSRSDERVATAFIIGGNPPPGVSGWADGQIVQCFASKYWGYHLGIKSTAVPPNSATPTELHKMSIGIEICNWGWLNKLPSGKFVNYVGGTMKPEEVIDLGVPYRGYRFWHNYTDAQIQSTKELLQYLGTKYNIPLKYKGKEMFDLDPRAFAGDPGVWTHTSVRKDKSDLYPHPKMIAMLESL